MPLMKVESDTSIYVEDWGQGTPFVFIHGWPFDHRVFEYEMYKLAQRGFRTVGIDLRGFGKSDKPWNGNDYDTWADDVARVIRGLHLSDVTLVGLSMGGAIATHYLYRHNDRKVMMLVLVGAATPQIAPDETTKQVINGFIQSDLIDIAKFNRQFMEMCFSQPPSAEYLNELCNMGLQASLRARMRGWEELRDRNLTTELGGITIPTLICHGINDKVVPFSITELQKKLLTNSTLVTFENSGHAICWEEKDKLTDEIVKFVATKVAVTA